CGYSVARNDHFKGVALVARIGQPSAHRHSLHIELNRRLYMNEETFEKSADFSRVQRDLDGLCAHLREFIRGLSQPPQGPVSTPCCAPHLPRGPSPRWPCARPAPATGQPAHRRALSRQQTKGRNWGFAWSTAV